MPLKWADNPALLFLPAGKKASRLVTPPLRSETERCSSDSAVRYDWRNFVRKVREVAENAKKRLVEGFGSGKEARKRLTILDEVVFDDTQKNGS